MASSILLTKEIDPEKRQLLLNEGLEVDTKDFIRIKFINTEKISLRNKTLIFTSANGVEGFFKNGFDAPHSSAICVGGKTESKLAEKGIKTLHTAKNAEELASFILQQQWDNSDFVHFCGNLALDTLEKSIANHNANYIKKIVYETELLYPTLNKKYDALVFFSPSGVRSFVKNNSITDEMVFCIGNTTALEVAKYTSQKPIISTKQNLNDLLSLVKSVV